MTWRARILCLRNCATAEAVQGFLQPALPLFLSKTSQKKMGLALRMCEENPSHLMSQSIALMFPGQGSQAPGMGQSLIESFPIARETFAQADEALGFSLSNLCAQGPKEELALTANTQPAILTTSIAAYRVLAQELDLSISCAMGHSLGEFSALVAAEALDFADAVRIVRARGQAMQEAVPAGVGAMAAIIGMEAEQLESLCQSCSSPQAQVTPANENGGGQIVVAGHAQAVGDLVAKAKEQKARAIPLRVSAPFHCSLMQPAADRLAQVLEGVQVGPMRFPVIANVDAQPNQDPAKVKSLLVSQVTGRVKWEASVQRANALGVTRAFEVGHGRVLAGLVKRIVPSLQVTALGNCADLDAIKGATA